MQEPKSHEDTEFGITQLVQQVVQNYGEIESKVRQLLTQKVAMRLLEEGVDTDIISRATDLTTEKIQQLQVSSNPKVSSANSRNNWSASGFGKYVSPDLVNDEFLYTYIVVLFQGNNVFGETVYTYLEISGRELKQVFACMQAGENFVPADYGVVLAAGIGTPSDEVRETMKAEYNMMDIPTPKKPTLPPKPIPTGNDGSQ